MYYFVYYIPLHFGEEYNSNAGLCGSTSPEFGRTSNIQRFSINPLSLEFADGFIIIWFYSIAKAKVRILSWGWRKSIMSKFWCNKCHAYSANKKFAQSAIFFVGFCPTTFPQKAKRGIIGEKRKAMVPILHGFSLHVRTCEIYSNV